MAYRSNYRRSSGPSPFAKVEVGDHASITVKSGEVVSGLVTSVDDRGVGLEYERQGGTFSRPTLEMTTAIIPWTNQKRRSILSSPNRAMVATFSSGAQALPYSRNGRRCEDAPCCGCCS